MHFLHANHFKHCDGFASAPDRRQMKPVVGPAASQSEAKAVARMERSEIRERWSGFSLDPGLRCAPSGLPRNVRTNEKKESGTP
jgi:hypothetical protein